jgi:hypothetical protein
MLRFSDGAIFNLVAASVALFPFFVGWGIKHPLK